MTGMGKELVNMFRLVKFLNQKNPICRLEALLIIFYIKKKFAAMLV